MALRKSDDLKAEYILLQGQYETFDQRALSMKALATPLLGAGLAFGIKEASTTLVVATVLVAITLWALESIWKGFQYCLVGRIETLEAWFRGEGPDELAPFQIYSAFGLAYPFETFGEVIWRMRKPFIWLPYMVVIIVGVALLVGSPTGGKSACPTGAKTTATNPGSGNR